LRARSEITSLQLHLHARPHLLVRAAALALLFAFSHDAAAAISLCANGALDARGQHGSEARFLLPLDPGLNAAATSSLRVSGRYVLIDVALGPASAPPLVNPNCFFVMSELSGGLEPGDYTARWTVRRLETCETGTCPVESASFEQAFTVALPLSCSDAAVFDVYPSPAIAGVPLTALSSHLSAIPWNLTPANVVVNGHQIVISQAGSYSGPPPPPVMYCVSTSAPLGVLPAGDYSVTWIIDIPGSDFIQQSSLQVASAPSAPALSTPSLVLLMSAVGVAGLYALARSA
jgi:hypothetical protein